MIAKTLFLTLVRKKARALLLLFSIAVCSALIFANAGFQKTVGQVIYDNSVRFCGNAELYIAVRQAVGAEEWIDTELLTPFAGRLKSVQELIRVKALYAPGDAGAQHYFTVLGTDMDELMSRNPFTLAAGSPAGWSGDKLIISAAYAERLGVAVQDEISLEINGRSRSFLIAGVSRPEGIFTRDVADGGYLLMPRETLAEMTGGQCNLMFLTAAAGTDINSLRQELTAAMPQVSVNFGIDRTVIAAETNNYVMPFWISSILVIFMSIFIIYTSYNLIINERVRIIGILRSTGASRHKVNGILLAESIVTGAAAGVIGCVLGIGVLYFIIKMFFSGNTDIEAAHFTLGGAEIIITLAAAMTLTVLSAMLPVLRITRVSVKNLILNNGLKPKINSGRFLILGISLFVPALFIPSVAGRGTAGIVMALTALILNLIGLNLMVPGLCHLAAGLLRNASWEIGMGVRNTGDFKALINNTRLFGTALAIMILMITLFHTLGTDVRLTYRRDPYDIQMELRESAPQTIEQLKRMEGVTDACGVFSTWGTVTNYGTFLNGLVGIEGMDYFDFYHADIPPETAAALDGLKENEIVTTTIFRDKFGLKTGDVLTVSVEEGTFDYRITGFLDTNWGIGHMGYIAADTYQKQLGAEHYTHIAVKTAGETMRVKENILRAYTRDVLTINTKEELENANADKVEGVFRAINSYGYFAMGIAFLGIINNISACFLGRKRSLMMYRCIGMTRQSGKRMLMAEALTIGGIGAAAGLGSGMLVIREIPYLVRIFWGEVETVVPWGGMIGMVLSGVIVMIFTAFIPFAMGKKTDIMDSIRYE